MRIIARYCAVFLVSMPIFARAAESEQVFEMNQGDRVSFDGLVLSQTSSLRPYGAAAFVIEKNKEILNGVGPQTVEDYQLCDISSLTDRSPLTLDKSSVFVVSKKYANPNSLRNLRFYDLRNESGAPSLRIACRRGVSKDKVMSGFKIIFHNQ